MINHKLEATLLKKLKGNITKIYDNIYIFITKEGNSTSIDINRVKDYTLNRNTHYSEELKRNITVLTIDYHDSKNKKHSINLFMDGE